MSRQRDASASHQPQIAACTKSCRRAARPLASRINRVARLAAALMETSMAWGIFGGKKQKASGAKRSDEQEIIVAELMMKAVVAAAAADGRRADGEMYMLAMLLGEFADVDMSDEHARHLYNRINVPGFDFLAELERHKALLAPAERQDILKKMYLVALSDGKADAQDIRIIAEASAILDVVQPEFGRCMDSAFEEYKRMTRQR
jgi:uncharacterized tellurite resistance protein B-like protein